ncbi:hypothetical protein PR048_014080 [Dryococelus australis]|uniref:Uncharacterized protein n=1 Tax=Dryococelus australis TaxID=614101 RepID=A0ABQ9HTZ6_9NEOP|nr:hypothetical protein PR048_014080 [Dryococelus australis]
MESDSDSNDCDISVSGSESLFSSISSEDADTEIDVGDARQWCEVNPTGQLPPSPPRFPFLSEAKNNFEINPMDKLVRGATPTGYTSNFFSWFLMASNERK